MKKELTVAQALKRQDDAMRARVAGKQTVAMRTVWQLQVGTFSLRCLVEDKGFVVQHRSTNGWTELTKSREDDDALTLLSRAIQTGFLRSQLRDITEAARLLAKAG